MLRSLALISKEYEESITCRYNAECRGIVSRYCKEWETIVNRLGRWIDFENGYRTMEPWYMESVWWVFKSLWEKGLVYRGYRVMPFSTALGTPLSNFEANQNYKEVTDPAVVIAFSSVDEESRFVELYLYARPLLTYFCLPPFS